MADPNELHRIVLCRIGNSNNFHSIPVQALNDESFRIASGRGQIILRDEDLKPNDEGKYIIDLAPLDLKYFYHNVDLPKSFEMPLEVLEARREKRRIKALEKGAVFIDRSGPEPRYFYIEGEKLRILQGDKEIIAEEIQITQGHKTVYAEGLDMGYLWLKLPGEVLKKWEPVLEANRLKKLAFIPASDSLTDLKKYYKLNMEIPSLMWSKVSNLFINWGDPDGWVTCEPGKVADILKIPIE